MSAALEQGLTLEIAMDTAKIILRNITGDYESLGKENEIEYARLDFEKLASIAIDKLATADEKEGRLIFGFLSESNRAKLLSSD